MGLNGGVRNVPVHGMVKELPCSAVAYMQGMKGKVLCRRRYSVGRGEREM